MSTYHPMFSGETTLRQDTEALLCAEPGAVEDRIKHFDELLTELGARVTIGAEIEYAMVDDPRAQEHDRDYDSEAFHGDVLKALDVNIEDGGWSKGAVIRPEVFSSSIMMAPFDAQRETWNTDQPDSDINEIRTAPAASNLAAKRYWSTIEAIGNVALEHGKLALILATHINGAAFLGSKDLSMQRLMQFHTIADSPALGAVQHNLNELYGLQTSDGLVTGIMTQEAFPFRKDATTTVHRQRLEFRHPLVGIVDPRIDALAMLGGVYDAIVGEVPAVALELLHHTDKVDIATPTNPDISEMIASVAVWDYQEKRLVMPALLDPNSYAEHMNERNRWVVGELTNGASNNWLEDNGETFRTILSKINIVDGRVEITEDNNPWYDSMQRFLGGASARFVRRGNRVLPFEIADSPAFYDARREQLRESPVAQRVFGKRLARIVSSPDARERRDAYFETHMITLEDER